MTIDEYSWTEQEFQQAFSRKRAAQAQKAGSFNSSQVWSSLKYPETADQALDAMVSIYQIWRKLHHEEKLENSMQASYGE